MKSPTYCVVALASIVCSALWSDTVRAVDAMAGMQHMAPAKARTATSISATNSFDGLMDSAMDAMNSGMASAPMTGDPDHDFAAMMVPHHQGAVDMAKAELLYGKNPILRRLAQEIIVTQGDEIRVMQLELKKIPHQSANTNLPIRKH